MKLLRVGKPCKEIPGIITAENEMYSVQNFCNDYDATFFAKGGVQELEKWFQNNRKSCKSIHQTERFGPPVKNPGKLICIGLNYADHAREAKASIPKEPILFFKATSAITGPNDDVIIPKGSEKTDWEVELAVVIGKKASYIEKEETENYIAGYLLHNDYSEREYQLERGGQWVKGKSCDTFAPLGPYLVTPDEIEDVNNQNLWLKVNGELKQNGNTSNLIFKVPHLVSYVSHFMTLHPGDIISTGTPPGVGMGCNPQQYLKTGDVVELGIDGLGQQKQQLVAWPG